MTLDIPRTLDDIDPKWLSAALDEGGLRGASVKSITPSSLGVGQGFMGQLARLAIEYESAPEEAPRSLVAKLPTADPGGQAIGNMMGLWLRESKFYERVAADVKIRVPRCYHNAAREEDTAYVLLLEDLAPLEPADQLDGASPEQARRVLSEIARFHASWWEDPRLDEFDWMPRVDGPQSQLIGPMFEAGWPGFVDRYRDRIDPRTIGWAESFVSKIQDWMQSYANEPVTIAHGDFRLDNMFFGKDGEYALIDWQMSMCCPGQADVVYFLATNVTPEVRREIEDDLLRLYYDTLLAEGVDGDGYAFDTLVRGYHEGLVFYTVMLGSGLQGIDPANPRGEALFDALVTRAFTAAAESGAGEIAGG